MVQHLPGCPRGTAQTSWPELRGPLLRSGRGRRHGGRGQVGGDGLLMRIMTSAVQTADPPQLGTLDSELKMHFVYKRARVQLHRTPPGRLGRLGPSYDRKGRRAASAAGRKSRRETCFLSPSCRSTEAMCATQLCEVHCRPYATHAAATVPRAGQAKAYSTLPCGG